MIARLRSGRPAPAAPRVRVEGRRLRCEDGRLCAVVRSSDFDVTALDEARAATVVAGFGRLCRTLDAHLQIVVQVRRWTDPPWPAAGPEDGIPARLRAAEEAHRVESLRRRAAFRRRLLLVPSVETGEADLDRAVTAVLAALAAAGAAAEVLEGDDLATLLEEAWGGDVAAAPRAVLGRPVWESRPREAASGTVWVRGYRLRRLPGAAVEPGWLAPLLLTRADCDIALHLEPTPIGEAMSRLSRRLRDLRADQLVDAEREGLGDAGVEAGVDGALDLRARLARNEGRSLRLSITGVARAATPTNSRRRARRCGPRSPPPSPPASPPTSSISARP